MSEVGGEVGGGWRWEGMAVGTHKVVGAVVKHIRRCIHTRTEHACTAQQREHLASKLSALIKCTKASRYTDIQYSKRQKDYGNCQYKLKTYAQWQPSWELTDIHTVHVRTTKAGTRQWYMSLTAVYLAVVQISRHLVSYCEYK